VINGREIFTLSKEEVRYHDPGDHVIEAGRVNRAVIDSSNDTVEK